MPLVPIQPSIKNIFKGNVNEPIPPSVLFSSSLKFTWVSYPSISHIIMHLVICIKQIYWNRRFVHEKR